MSLSHYRQPPSPVSPIGQTTGRPQKGQTHDPLGFHFGSLVDEKAPAPLRPMLPQALLILLCLTPAALLAQAPEVPIRQPFAPTATPAEPLEQENLGELVDDALHRLKSKAQKAGQDALLHKDYPAALRAFERAYELDPSDVGSTRNLARLHTLLGNRSEAERYFRESLQLEPQGAETHLALARLLAEDQEDPERLAEADELLLRSRQLGGPPTEIALSRARVAHASSRFDVAAREYDAAVKAGADDAPVLLEVGDFYRDIGESEEALAWYRRVERPHTQVRLAAQRIFDLEVDKEARRSLHVQGSSIHAAALKEQLTRARVAASRGKRDVAKSLLRSLIARAPEQPSPRAQLGALLREEPDQQVEAERLLLQAVAMDGDPSAQRELALLYLEQDPPQRNEGIFFLRRALRLRPEYWELHLLAAETERNLGDLPAALQHVRRYLRQNNSQQERERALQLERELSAAVKGASDAPPDADAGVTTQALHRAQAHLGRGATSAALAELSRLPKDALDERVWNLRAAILQATGDQQAAQQALTKSLGHNDRQPDVRVRLAELLLGSGQRDAAEHQLLLAEDAGAIEATYQLALLDIPEDPSALSGLLSTPHPLSLRAARERLRTYLSSGQGAHHPQAKALLAQTERQLNARLGLLFGLVLVLPVGLFILRKKRTAGIDVPTLVALYPETTGEVLRVLSAIRHEVLKHNTLMLTSIVSALQRGQAPGSRGQHLQRALLGNEDNPGAAQRLEDYATELKALGRAHGQRINLEYRDQTLAPLLTGMRHLSRLCPQVVAADHMRPKQRQRLGKRLMAIHRQVNEDGYNALQTLLVSIRSLEVSEGLLQRIYDRVRNEPALASQAIAPLQVRIESDALPCHLEMPQAAFEDVLANLLRNALQASVQSDGRSQADGQAAEVAIVVRRDEDPITGLTRALFLVCDRAQEQLDESMLRGGYIEQGLGLTADLVARYDGELSVQDGEMNFSKAVTLALPCRSEEASCAF